MSSNVFKGGYAISYSNEIIKIDSNETIKKKLEELKASQIVNEEQPEEENVQGFVEGIDPVQVAQLVGDSEDDLEAKIIGNTLSEIQDNSDVSVLVDQVNAQADEILAEANAQAEKIKNEAFESGHSEGFEKGYNEGHAQADAEINELRNKLESEYQQMKQELTEEYETKMAGLEPALISKLTEIYRHVTGVNLSDSEETILYLLKRSLSELDVSKGYVIHVSEFDHELVKNSLSELSKVSGVLPENIEIVEDHSLEKNGCMIETEGGIFDVGLDTQLKLLSKQLKILSMN